MRIIDLLIIGFVAAIGFTVSLFISAVAFPPGLVQDAAKMGALFSFGAVFNRLNEEYKLSTDDAFSLTIRVFRGGGFTKDYLYLRGFKDLLMHYKNNNITHLLVGKTGLEFSSLISELLERKILNHPVHAPNIFSDNVNTNNKILDYLLYCLN